MFNYSFDEIITALISAFLIGFSKTTGTSLGTVVIPFFTNIFPAKTATGILCIAFLLASFQAFKIHFNHVKFLYFKLLFPWVLLGLFLGGVTLLSFEEQTLKRCICIIILVMLIFNMGKFFYDYLFEKVATSKLFDITCGVLIGATSMIANSASPVMVVYLLAKKEPKNSFIGTQIAFFLLMDFLKIPFYIFAGVINTSSLSINLMMLPLMLLGGTVGFFFIKWIPESRFRTLVVITSGLGALKLGWSTL